MQRSGGHHLDPGLQANSVHGEKLLEFLHCRLARDHPAVLILLFKHQCETKRCVQERLEIRSSSHPRRSTAAVTSELADMHRWFKPMQAPPSKGRTAQEQPPPVPRLEIPDLKVNSSKWPDLACQTNSEIPKVNVDFDALLNWASGEGESQKL